jgi:hypothetical protein
MDKVAIAAAATDLISVRFVFTGFLQLVRTRETLTMLCDENVTYMTIQNSMLQVLLKHEYGQTL